MFFTVVVISVGFIVVVIVVLPECKPSLTMHVNPNPTLSQLSLPKFAFSVHASLQFMVGLNHSLDVTCSC